jgi:hypothetical protein
MSDPCIFPVADREQPEGICTRKWACGAMVKEEISRVNPATVLPMVFELIWRLARQNRQ